MSDIVIKLTKKSSGGKKARKYGRQKKSPAHMRYNAQERWIENKEKRIAKDKKRQKKSGMKA
jgi:hypothetical protein